MTLTVAGAVRTDPVHIFVHGDEDAAVRGFTAEAFHPHWWGAKADGETNDTRALRRLGAHVSDLGGGRISLVGGTYVVGEQEFTGLADGRAYRETQVLYIEGCDQPVIIESDGAILRAQSGLFVGAFDPVTGEPADTEYCDIDHDQLAGLYNGMIELHANADVIVRDVELDGNMGELTIGGYWGCGYGVPGSGISADSNDALTIEDVYTHHQVLDGVYLSDSLQQPDDLAGPIQIARLRSEYNSRQGLSWVGGVRRCLAS